MEQIYVHSSLENQEEIIKNKSIGMKQNNTIQYIEDGIQVTLSIEENKLYLKRENDDYKLEFFFDKNENTKGIYYIKEEDMYLEIPIETRKLIINEDEITIEYELIQEEYRDRKNLRLLFEVIE